MVQSRLNWAKLTSLEYLDLKKNQLSGEIPPELVNLTNLKELYLRNNLLTGCAPASWRRAPITNWHPSVPYCEMTDPAP